MISKIKSILIFIGLSLMAVVYSSCDSQRIFEQNIDLKQRFWAKDSIARFDFRIDDISSRYNIYYNVRNTNTYPNHNLYITYYLEDSTGNILKKELNNQQLFHPKTGKPFGRSGLGDIYDHQFLLLENYQFSKRGLYHMKLEHFMRYDTLPEVVSLGIRVEKSEQPDQK
ncbi:MAG: gliding motility lipoprotein GldH [Bacteroidota bacterium]